MSTLESIDNAVRSDDELAKIRSAVLRNNATDFWEHDDMVERGNKAHNQKLGIVGGVASHVVTDRLEIFNGLLGPAKAGHPSKRRFTSSWVKSLPAFA